MKLNARQFDTLVGGALDIPAVLIYGQDAGLVSERAQAVVAALAGSPPDPFRLAELSADAVHDDPARLADEAAALCFTGGRRAVRIAAATDRLAPHLGDWLAGATPTPDGNVVVVEAADLPPRSKLRKLFEDHKQAAAVACYRDDATALDQLISSVLEADGVSIDSEARAQLAASLGSDRLISRQELDKLVTFAGPHGHITLNDVQQSVGDSAALALDDLAFAVTRGDRPAVDRTLGRLWAEGTAPVSVLRAVARHLRRLLDLSEIRKIKSLSANAALEHQRVPKIPGLRRQLEGDLVRWSPEPLTVALRALTEAEALAKRTGSPDALVVARVLLKLAGQVRGQPSPHPPGHSEAGVV